MSARRAALAPLVLVLLAACAATAPASSTGTQRAAATVRPIALDVGVGAIVTAAPTLAAPHATATPAAAASSALTAGISMRPKGSAAGSPLGFVAYVPPAIAADPDARPPLLVVLHGSGESGPGTGGSLKLLLGGSIGGLIESGQWPSDRPFVVLLPQHAETEAAPCFTATEIDAFLRFAIATYRADPTRVYLTGYSCGGIGIWNYLAAHGNELVAAVVPIAGDGRDAFRASGCSLGDVPIWAFAGRSDPVVDPDGSIDPIGELQRCTTPSAVDARLTLYPGVGHDSWDRTYDGSAGYDIYGWLLTNRAQ